MKKYSKDIVYEKKEKIFLITQIFTPDSFDALCDFLYFKYYENTNCKTITGYYQLYFSSHTARTESGRTVVSKTVR